MKITATVWATASLPVQTNAISFVEKEAAAYDEAAVLENKKKAGSTLPASTVAGTD